MHEKYPSPGQGVGRSPKTNHLEAISLNREWSSAAKALKWSHIVKPSYLEGNQFFFVSIT